jgi:uncharacterized protein involved in exopolysaccharide biosynthesis
MNNNETFDLADGIQVIRRNFFLFSASLVICATAAVLLAIKLPKQFKSKAVMSIQSSYFRNPMVNDLITEVNDPQELQAQRMSLLRLALSNHFIDSLASKYDLYSEKAALSEEALTVEREQFLSKIRYYSLSPTTFEIATIAERPEEAQKITAAVLERMKSTLIDERFENLDRTKKAIESHVKNLGDNIQKIATPTGEIAVQSELDHLESTLAGLLMKFTESHPEVQKLRSRQKSLSAHRPKSATKEVASPSDDVIARGGILAKQPSQEVYNDLLKKLSYLAIVLDMEKDRDNLSYLGVIEQPTLPVQALFPNKRLFLAIGLVIGVLLGAFLSIIAELGRRSVISPNQAANLLDAPLLGELPLLTQNILAKTAVKALPAGAKFSENQNLLAARNT